MHISSFISSIVFVSRFEQKLVPLLVYLSLRRKPTITQRIFFTESGSQIRQVDLKWEVNTVSIRFQYNTTTQPSGCVDCDVTRLLLKEHKWNEYSLLDTFTLH